MIALSTAAHSPTAALGSTRCVFNAEAIIRIGIHRFCDSRPTSYPGPSILFAFYLSNFRACLVPFLFRRRAQSEAMPTTSHDTSKIALVQGERDFALVAGLRGSS